MLASASVPGLFPPVEFDGKLLMDGGTVYNTNVEEAIERCLEIVSDKSKIILDVLVCTEDEIDGVKPDKKGSKTIGNWLRAREISDFVRGENSITAAKRAHPEVTFRHTIKQSKAAKGFDKLDFSPKTTWPLQETGRKDAQKELGILESHSD